MNTINYKEDCLIGNTHSAVNSEAAVEPIHYRTIEDNGKRCACEKGCDENAKIVKGHHGGSPDDCPACPRVQIGATPTMTHSMGCAKLYGNLCSCGADHKVPAGSTVSNNLINQCEHWFRELMQNNQKEFFFYCQKCILIKKQKI